MSMPTAKSKSELKYYLLLIHLLWEKTPENPSVTWSGSFKNTLDKNITNAYLADFREQLGPLGEEDPTADIYDLEAMEEMYIHEGYTLEALEQNFGLNAAAIAKAFKLEQKKQNKGTKKPVTGRWTHLEIALLIEYYSPLDVSKAEAELGRSPRAINLKAKELGLVEFLNEIELPNLREYGLGHRIERTVRHIIKHHSEHTAEELKAHHRISDVHTIIKDIQQCEAQPYILKDTLTSPGSQNKAVEKTVLQCGTAVPDDVISYVFDIPIQTVINIRSQLYNHYKELEIIADHENRLVRVGKWTIEHWAFSFLRSERELKFKNEILRANDIPVIQIPATLDKGALAQRQFYARHLGNKFNYRLRGAAYSVFIKPIKNELERYCSAFKRASKGAIRFYPDDLIEPCFYVWQNGLIQEAENDGIDHVVPWIIYFRKSPAELKRALGKSLWKTLTANNLQRNISLMHVLLCYEKTAKKRIPSTTLYKPNGIWGHFADAYYLKTLQFNRIGEAKRLLPTLQTIKKTWLKHLRSEGTIEVLFMGISYVLDSAKLIKWFDKVARVTDPDSINKCHNLLADVYNMAEQLNLPMKLKSLNKLQNYHDHLVKLSNQKRKEESRRKRAAIIKAFNARMAWCQNVWDRASSLLERTDVEIEVIADYPRLVRESDDMWHCVADHVNYITHGVRYMVFHLKGARQESTLGVWFDGENWKVNQHYGYDNCVIECDDLLECQKYIVDALNEKAAIKVYSKKLSAARVISRVA